jgi:hypothetical protein
MSNSKINRVRLKSPVAAYWTERFAESWDELIEIKKKDFSDLEGKKFIFRGQGLHGDLKTSIERAFEEFEIDGDDRQDCEKQLIRSFQRKAPYHLKGICVPTKEDTLEWLSLMQHHEAPTRLLDWTYSFYRALHNAVSKNTRKDKLCGKYESELWVMNTRWFTNKTEGDTETGVQIKRKGILWDSIEDSIKSKEKDIKNIKNNIKKNAQKSRNREASLVLKKAKDALDEYRGAKDALDKIGDEGKDYKGELANNRNKLVQYLIDLEKPLSLVYNVTPIGLNERIIYQQGTFVLPGDITKCFMQNLEPYKKDNCKDNLFRIVIKLELKERNKIVEELNDMNINDAVLFPGIDGFAKSLRLKLAFLNKR